MKVLGYEDGFWKVVCDGTIGYAHSSTVAMNDDMIPLKASAMERPRSVVHPTHTVSTTHSVSNPTDVKYAPLSSAQPGNCTINDRKYLIDSRYVVEGTYLMNQPYGSGTTDAQTELWRQGKHHLHTKAPGTKSRVPGHDGVGREAVGEEVRIQTETIFLLIAIIRL